MWKRLSFGTETLRLLRPVVLQVRMIRGRNRPTSMSDRNRCLDCQLSRRLTQGMDLLLTRDGRADRIERTFPHARLDCIETYSRGRERKLLPPQWR